MNSLSVQKHIINEKKDRKCNSTGIFHRAKEEREVKMIGNHESLLELPWHTGVIPSQLIYNKAFSENELG